MSEHFDNNELDQPQGLPEGADLDFLGENLEQHGLDLAKEPGSAPSMIPEGNYWAQFAWKITDELTAENPLVPGISARWKVNKTKGDKPQTYLGTSIKAKLLRPAPSRNKISQPELTMEEFDSLGLAGRELNAYVSTMVLYGRTGASDFLKSVNPEIPAGLSAKQMAQAIEELMPTSPEGVISVKWTPYYKQEGTDGKTEYKRLSTIPSMKDKYKGGSKSFPKNEDGTPATAWSQPISQEETLDVVVFAEQDNFLPYKAE